MSIWQTILIGGWALAVIAGADRRIALIMAADFIVTACLPGEIGPVGLADLICALMLIQLGQRGKIIAMLYAVSAAINSAGTLGLWSLTTTYAILDPIGWAMLAVLGRVDAGLRKLYFAARGFGRRNNPDDISVAAGRDAGISVAVVSGTGDR